MSFTLSAMVEELAFLVKDNLTCKHLILSVEEALVEFLHNDSSQDGVLELEPMSSYNRLLLHRLADIFGFAHVSVGEGDDRHLVLERCPESSIPPVLVSDILSEYDEFQYPSTSHQLLRRKEAIPALKTNTGPLSSSLEEREAAYLAARERIFSVDNGEAKDSVTPKERNIPVVARRMIAHALGKSIHSSLPTKKVDLPIEQIEGVGTSVNNNRHLNGTVEVSQETTFMFSRKVSLEEKRMHGSSNGSNASTGASQRKVEKKLVNNKSSSVGAPQSGSSRRTVCADSLKRENLGAAKRIFGHALQGAKGVDGLLLKCKEVKATDKE